MKPQIETVSGTVEEYNFSPRGGIEGVIVRVDGKRIQINFPPEEEATALLAIGQPIVLSVEPDAKAHKKHGEGEHPVYLAAPMSDSDDGKHGETVHVEGIVKRLNFARHGEANGFVLDNGDFIHLKPEGMKAVPLTVGQRAVVEGKARLVPLGLRAIEAEIVNGVAIRHKK